MKWVSEPHNPSKAMTGPTQLLSDYVGNSEGFSGLTLHVFGPSSQIPLSTVAMKPARESVLFGVLRLLFMLLQLLFSEVAAAVVVSALLAVSAVRSRPLAFF